MAIAKPFVLVLTFAITFVYFTIEKSSAASYTEKFFDQYIDHFNFASFGNKTYKQRYLINDKWWVNGKGPIFFYTGNEGNVVSYWNNSGFIFDIAPKFQALVVFAEHFLWLKETTEKGGSAFVRRWRETGEPGERPPATGRDRKLLEKQIDSTSLESNSSLIQGQRVNHSVPSAPDKRLTYEKSLLVLSCFLDFNALEHNIVVRSVISNLAKQISDRYYGISFPFGKASFQPEYIGLLTVEQALADYATLLTALKRTLNATQCPVIAFGGSYGGMLSAYMRVKYPHIIDGAIAASAPVYMAALVTPRDFFFIHVTKDFNDINPQCKMMIQEGFQELDSLAATGVKGLQTISSMFNLCTPLTNQTDYRHLLLWIRNVFPSLAMGDYPYPATFIANLPAFPVKVACGKIAQSQDKAVGLFQITEMAYGSPKCHNIWYEFVECADPTGCGLGTDAMAWDYQACTEILLPAGTNNITDMFPNLPFTLQQRQDYCQKRWGVVPRDDWLSIQMFQKGLKGSSNIVFSNGDLDPWMEGGVLENVSNSIVSVIIEGGAHHLDLRGSNKADPKSVVVARQTEALYIKKWIASARKRCSKHNYKYYNHV